MCIRDRSIFGSNSDEQWLHTTLMHLDKLKLELGQDNWSIYVLEHHNEILSEVNDDSNTSAPQKRVISRTALNLMLDFINFQLK
jgi:hypothetical protein